MDLLKIVLLSGILLFLVFGVRVLVSRLFQTALLAGIADNRFAVAAIGGLCRTLTYAALFLVLGSALSLPTILILWSVLSLLDYFVPVTGTYHR